MITQEAPLGRKARRQRFTLQKINELSGEIVTLRAQLDASEAAMRARASESAALRELFTDRLTEVESRADALEAEVMERRLEVERLESDKQFLRDELEQVKVQKELLKLDYDRLAVELKAIKVARARNDIDAWRAVGNTTPWKRCYQRIEGLFRKDRNDATPLAFDNFLRLPPP